MQSKRRFTPSVEPLENRWVPANVQFVSGFLLISPSSGEAALNLRLTQTAPNNFSVKDGASTLGTFGPVSNILITGGNGADTVTVDLNALTYAGNLFANLGNGNDTISVQSAGAAALLGNTTILTGLGNGAVKLASGAAGGINFGGTIQVVDTTPGSKVALTFGNATAASRVGQSLNITGMDTVTLGAGAADTVGGSVTVTDSILTSGVSVTVANKFTVNNNLSITTGNGNDSITINSATINGSTNVNTNGGNDSVTLAGTPTFGGSVTLQGASGNDSVTVGVGLAGATVNGNLSISLGDGNDTVTVNSASNVAGNLNITLGAGADSVVVDATVSGNMSFRLGNGNDTVTIGNAPAGTLNWTSGNGNDSVTLGDATNSAGEVWNVNMRFGTGSDTLTLAGNGTVASPEGLTGFIDMGGPPAGNQFDPTGSLAAGTWVTISPFTLQNV
jgi:hypothetical protein